MENVNALPNVSKCKIEWNLTEKILINICKKCEIPARFPNLYF